MLISNRIFDGARRSGCLFFNVEESCSSGNNRLFLMGDFYPRKKTPEEVLTEILAAGGEQFAKNNLGEYLVFLHHMTRNTLTLVNGRLGKETCYLFADSSNLIIGTDFWQVAGLLDNIPARIDGQSCREFVLFKRPLFHTTIIRDLNYLPPASVVSIDVEQLNVEILNYWDYRYISENSDLQSCEIVSIMDDYFEQYTKTIRGRYDEHTVYGIGLSGGMDSRLAAYYLKRNGMELNPYIIGKKKRNPFLRTMSFYHARKVGKELGVRVKEIDVGSGNFFENSFRNLRYLPIGPLEYFICRFEELPLFDVYFSGMYGGEMWGQIVPADIEEIKRRDLPAYLIKNFSYLGGRDRIADLLSKRQYEGLRGKFEEFMENREDYSNLNILQNILYMVFISKNKNSMFEDLCGMGNCLTPFLNPDLVEFSLTLDEKWFIGLKLQREFFVQKLQGLGRIGEERPWAPICYRDTTVLGRVHSFFARAEFRIRKGGMKRGEWARNDSYFVECCRSVFGLDNPVFEEVFLGLDPFDLLFSENSRDSNLFRQLVKVKMLLDVIFYDRIGDLVESTEWRDWQSIGMYEI